MYHTGLEIDEVLARYAPLGNRTLLTDALMSVIAQANDDETVSNFYAYSPYGETTALGPDEGNALQYTGRENDGTGLYYYRARYYDPQLKRFASEDPIGVFGDINVYRYVNGNPINLNDPYGLQVAFPGGGATGLGGSSGLGAGGALGGGALGGSKSSSSTGLGDLGDVTGKDGSAANDPKYDCPICYRQEIRIVITYTGSDGNSVKVTRCYYYCPESRLYRYLDVNQLSVTWRCTLERREDAGWSGVGKLGM